jgi:hypothetical protein
MDKTKMDYAFSFEEGEITGKNLFFKGCPVCGQEFQKDSRGLHLNYSIKDDILTYYLVLATVPLKEFNEEEFNEGLPERLKIIKDGDGKYISSDFIKE